MCDCSRQEGGYTHLEAAGPGYHSSRRSAQLRSDYPDHGGQPWRGCLHPQPRPEPFLAHRVHCQRPEAFLAGISGFRAVPSSCPRPPQQRRANRSSPSGRRGRPRRPPPWRTVFSWERTKKLTRGDLCLGGPKPTPNDKAVLAYGFSTPFPFPTSSVVTARQTATRLASRSTRDCTALDEPGADGEDREGKDVKVRMTTV